MRKTMIFLNIILILGITTLVYSLRGPVDGRRYNRNGHDKTNLYSDEIEEGVNTHVGITYDGSDIDGPLESVSAATAALHAPHGTIEYYVDALAITKCHKPGYKGKFYVSATLHHSWVNGQRMFSLGPKEFAGVLTGIDSSVGNAATAHFAIDYSLSIQDCSAEGWIEAKKIEPEPEPEPEQPPPIPPSDPPESMSGGCVSGGCVSGGCVSGGDTPDDGEDDDGEDDDDGTDEHYARSKAPFEAPRRILSEIVRIFVP